MSLEYFKIFPEKFTMNNIILSEILTEEVSKDTNIYFDKNKSNLDIVTQWNTAFSHTPLKRGEEPSISQRDLRIGLIFEELTELADACGREGTMLDLCYKYLNNINKVPLQESLENDQKNTNIFNKVEVLDALCDLEVVGLGGYNALGFTEVAKEAYNRTMISNFSKAATTTDEVNHSVAYYHSQGIETEGRISPDKKLIIIVNSKTNKILKNQSTYKVPDYTGLI